MFCAQGYHAAQMNDLARAAGTTKPTLYARLGSKEQLYVRVLEREAQLLQHSLYSEYERAAAEPLDEVVGIAMFAFFRFADRRRAGFELLFRGGTGVPGRDIGERAMSEVIGHVRRLIDRYISRTGHEPGAGTALLAAAGVGVARQVCEYALEHGLDLTAAGELATAFTETGMRRLDPGALLRLGIRQPDAP